MISCERVEELEGEQLCQIDTEDGRKKRIIAHIHKKNGAIWTVWIRSKGYEPKTSMENLIAMIFGYYEDTDEVRERGYFGI